MNKRPVALPRTVHLVLAAALVLLAACGGSGGGTGGGTATPSGAPTTGTAAAVTVTGAWVRAGQQGMMSAAYFTVANAGGSADAVTGVTTNVGMASLHKTSTDSSGMTGMSPVEKVEVPAGGSVAFEPGGFHVMLMGLSKELKAGDTVELVVSFAGGAQVTVNAEVRAG